MEKYRMLCLVVLFKSTHFYSYWYKNWKTSIAIKKSYLMFLLNHLYQITFYKL